ncbi:MAG: nuclear transport factor 2 family protein [Crocosphaera sp.]
MTENKTLEVGKKAFGKFTHGLETGEWDGFLEMVTDDFTFWFPTGQYHGLNQGKDKAREFFAFVSEAFSEGLFVTLDNIVSNEKTVIFEFKDEGLIRGVPYKNRVAIAFDIQGDKISAYREYYGSDGKSN